MAADAADREAMLVVAGEPSGDRAAAAVVERLAARTELAPFGVGGDRLAQCGVELLAHIDDLTALGLGAAFGHAAAWGRAWIAVRRAVAARRPAVALLVDAPEINLPLARVLSAAGVRVLFYIGPQVWAWRPGRLGLLRTRTAMVALVLPFEQALYARAGVRARFVGHPLLDEPPAGPREAVRARLAVESERPLVALLPGSRSSEVSALGPPLIECAERLVGRGIDSVMLPGAGAGRAAIEDAPGRGSVRLAPPDLSARDLLAASDAALVASGTATLEAALERVPLAVVYRLDWLSWRAARLLVDVPFVGLPNWVAGRPIVPELLQREVTGERLARQAVELLEPAERRRQRQELDEVRRRLGAPGAAARVARLLGELAR
jgi:lipid-A-disaccharide synthase